MQRLDLLTLVNTTAAIYRIEFLTKEKCNYSHCCNKSSETLFLLYLPTIIVR